MADTAKYDIIQHPGIATHSGEKSYVAPQIEMDMTKMVSCNNSTHWIEFGDNTNKIIITPVGK